MEAISYRDDSDSAMRIPPKQGPAPQRTAEVNLNAAPDYPESSVQVILGAMVENLPLEGATVAQAREGLREPFRINPHAAALVNGREVSSGHRLRTGDVLEFVRSSGEKGSD